MCGIAGCVVAPGGEVQHDLLEAMRDALAHRGPDATGICVRGSTGLAHTRLAIVELSEAGAQPMASADGRWIITYNGEAFGHDELRPALGAVPWRGHSDTETVVEALARLGPEEALPRLNGLFAFAALDIARGRVLLVRDRFGVKPLYVARRDGAIWFASEVKALRAAGVADQADPALLRHSVAAGWINGRLTPWTRVERLLPGTMAEIDLETLALTESRWYDPAAVVERPAPRRRSPRTVLVDELEAALRTSVRRRLMSDAPLGTMCSGGIDSGLITAFAAEAHPGLRAFNVQIADQPEHDESEHAAAVAARLGTPLETIPMTAEDWRHGFVRAVWHVEYPLLHPSSVPMSGIARAAAASGIKVLLSGEGADELFGGYAFLHHEEWLDFVSRRRRLRALVGRGAGGDDGTGGEAATDLEGRDPRVDAYEAAVRDRASLAYEADGGARRALEAALLADLSTYLPHLLNRQDRTTMQESVETRVPFLDPDVVAFALNLPLEARVRPAAKGILRELALRHLPPSAVERPKLGFGFAAERYLLGAVDPAFLVDGRLREVLGVTSDAWRTGVAASAHHLVLLLWSAEVWCRLFLDGDPIDAVEAALWHDITAPIAGPAGP